MAADTGAATPCGTRTAVSYIRRVERACLMYVRIGRRREIKGESSSGRVRARRFVSHGMLFLSLSLIAAFASSGICGPPRPGSVGEVQIPAPSLSESSRVALVYLPPSYMRPESRSRRFTTVYLLHGGPGGPFDWAREGQVARTLGDLIGHRMMPEVIVIMPDAQGRARLRRSLYVNSFDGSVRMEDFIVHDVVAWADRVLRTQCSPSGRVLIGLSDGGGAAVNLAFKHPEVFGACGGLSGDYRLRRCRGCETIFGPEPRAGQIVRGNSPLEYVTPAASSLRNLKIYLDCGIFDIALLDAVELDRKLTQLRIPHTLKLRVGSHDWGTWRRGLATALVALTR